MAKMPDNTMEYGDLRKLTWYDLQKALYQAHGLYDQPDTREEGRRRIHAVYDEYARRGVTRTKRPVAAG